LTDHIEPFAGRTVAHYKILAKLGGGGMGVVYKAQDLKLDRLVALKFLPPQLTWHADDGGAALRERFMQEARAASALDHPNIGTIFDIDETDDGQVFIAMAYYDGETLKKKIERGRLSVADAHDICIQAARGLKKAHEAGIVHRDINPSNLMITSDGVVKIIDFGLAKLGDRTRTRMTAPGTTLGTVPYMAPEQVRGDEVDTGADVWSLGVVLYQSLTGTMPFPGANSGAITHAILNAPPAPALDAQPEVPEAFRHIVSKALRKDPAQRYRAGGELLDDLLTVSAAPDQPGSRRGTRIGAAMAAGIIILTTLGLIGARTVKRNSRIAWARGEALPQIARLADRDANSQAFALANDVAAILPGDATLTALWPRIAVDAQIDVTPAGADISVKDYDKPSDAWRRLGASPLARQRLSRGLKRWKFEKAGFHPLEIATDAGDLKVTLPSTDAVPADMVPVPGGRTTGWIAGMDPIDAVRIDDYLIDRFEVTNRQFKAFIDRGGYRAREFWKHPFVKDGRTIPWEQAVAEFRDPTGRPGPSTWQLGEYPKGEDDYPVSGVSWYEAAAYAEFAGKSLPTVYHWVRAAGTRLPAAISPLSNIGTKAVAAVGTYQGLGPFGTYDMAGNVREWCWNGSGGKRHLLGGAWSDPVYLFTFANALSPWDRAAANGFRCVKYPKTGQVPENAAQDVALSFRDYSKERPVGDDVFRLYAQQFSYDPTPLGATVDATQDTSSHRQEKITINAAYGNERLAIYVLLPKTAPPPFQAIVTFPGSSAIVQSNSGAFYNPRQEFVVKSGRALIMPVYKGTYERNDGLTSTWPSATHKHSDYLIKQVQDVRRTLDYLATRKDIDTSKIAYQGISWGGRLGAIIPAVEPRFKTAIIDSGGLAGGRSLPEVDQINYVTRVTIPVLMLNGRFDAIEPVESSQLPMFRLLGTPAEHKRHVIYEAAHGDYPENAYIKEVLDWLDKYLGPAR
jgi:eukaryotic-like serine/threonine-protein kinase